MRKSSPIRDRFSQYLAQRVGKSQANSFIYSNRKQNQNRYQMMNPHSPRQQIYPKKQQQLEYSPSPSSINSSMLCFTTSQSNTEPLSSSHRYQNSNGRRTMTIHKKKRLRKLCEVQQNTCPICLQYISDKAKMSCGHNFCYGCLKQWLNTSSTCPYCRTDCTFFFYRNTQNMIQQKAFRYQADFPEQFVQEDDGLDYQCYLCQRTREGDTVIICDQCLIHACHPQCDSRIRRPLDDDQEWFCHFCS